MLENIPANEPQQIQHIVELTMQQFRMRYPGDKRVLRGVHAKAHGCVTATFEVLPVIDESLRQGVFSVPGKKYSALVRFSNASTQVTPDSTPGTNGGPPAHGSRGMAIKLLGVEGTILEPAHGAPTQDFLMVNHPVFAFANVEDYEVLSRALLFDGKDSPVPFFTERLPPKDSILPPPGFTLTPTSSQQRALETCTLVQRIRSASDTATPLPAFQVPPARPVANDYFRASPFLFGPAQVMRFCVRPRSRSTDEPQVSSPNYMRTALVERLRDQAAGEVVFDFAVQVRAAGSINSDVDIENASRAWPDTFPFVPVATLAIALQEFDTEELRERCERLVFTPWHCLEAHRPLGGINRLRRAVYEASAKFRNLPKEPAVVD